MPSINDLFLSTRSNDTENLYLVGKAAKNKQLLQAQSQKSGASTSSISPKDNVFESTQMDPFVAVRCSQL